eukprot:CAMPEP_0194539934 /NCGR_PEP_ID=MMETSP0253-20130528/80049_1 /TAXON_ID=2966 /ORGANISM="Noctiluca scintillans" /LENGTH=119 /DNA_ID=CAMNT_0039386259 /DNA_START=144 /DNA_END=503 /DNA_ORIENTATION=+
MARAANLQDACTDLYHQITLLVGPTALVLGVSLGVLYHQITPLVGSTALVLGVSVGVLRPALSGNSYAVDCARKLRRGLPAMQQSVSQLARRVPAAWSCGWRPPLADPQLNNLEKKSAS